MVYKIGTKLQLFLHISKKKCTFAPQMEQEKQHIGQLFDRIARTYDGLNHGLSLNIDRSWRCRAVRRMKPSRHVLDVAIGTADLAIEMLRKGKAEQVTGLDFFYLLDDKIENQIEKECKPSAWGI
jgi:demethylmenaquinone methyltransferase/2-methoxy-6-polyprenyl-1,4-benzoquinol methylase